VELGSCLPVTLLVGYENHRPNSCKKAGTLGLLTNDWFSIVELKRSSRACQLFIASVSDPSSRA